MYSLKQITYNYVFIILLILYISGAIGIFTYTFGKRIKTPLRVIFKLPVKPYQIWPPFIVGELFWKLRSTEPASIEIIIITSIMHSIIYPVYLPIYFIQTRIKYLIFKMVATKEEQVQRALGADQDENINDPSPSAPPYNR